MSKFHLDSFAGGGTGQIPKKLLEVFVDAAGFIGLLRVWINLGSGLWEAGEVVVSL